MKKTVISAVMAIAIGLWACTEKKNTEEKVENSQIQKVNNMNNLISIVEIPTNDFSRAVKFYQTILGVVIEEIDMGGNKMGVLPSKEGTVNVVLIKENDNQPASNGTVVYLNAGSNLQPTLDKISENGGQVIVPKTEISPEIGHFALFIDSEGNKLGLHSTN